MGGLQVLVRGASVVPPRLSSRSRHSSRQQSPQHFSRRIRALASTWRHHKIGISANAERLTDRHGMSFVWGSLQGYDNGGGGTVQAVRFERVYGQGVHTGIVVDLLQPQPTSALPTPGARKAELERAPPTRLADVTFEQVSLTDALVSYRLQRSNDGEPTALYLQVRCAALRRAQRPCHVGVPSGASEASGLH